MRPIVLCFSGLDPSGGAGLQADIEAINAQLAHPATIATCLTVQDTRNVEQLVSIDPDLVLRQARLILDDMPVKTIKLGLLGSTEMALAIAEILQQHSQIPVVCDPVLAAGGGNPLANQKLIDVLKSEIFPHCRLITPNIPEALRLTDQAEELLPALSLLESEACLLTGSHANTSQVDHILLTEKQTHHWSYVRLAQQYHGSGCTLAASIAALLASNMSIVQAVKQGLDYTYASLQQAQPLGRGQWIPQRLEMKQK